MCWSSLVQTLRTAVTSEPIAGKAAAPHQQLLIDESNKGEEILF